MGNFQHLCALKSCVLRCFKAQGKFFSICSDYIEKLDNIRSKVRRKLKAGQTQDVMAMTDPEDMRKVEYKELMDNFDDIFLSLYPNFVEKFNALLKPGCEIRPN